MNATEATSLVTHATAGPPPPVQMVQLLTGFQVAQALYVAAKLNVAGHLLDGPRSVNDLALAVGAHPQSLGRLLRTLGSLGVFSETAAGDIELTPLAATLAEGTPGSMHDLAHAALDHRSHADRLSMKHPE